VALPYKGAVTMAKDAFITEEFLLETPAAQRLYHEYAEGLPIIDYHCHLPPKQIADDVRFENLTQIWLYGDHYKWRLMRANGAAERFCTGDASDWEKFVKWAETVPHTLRNPLYHWTHLELKRGFGVGDCLLSPATAKDVWDRCGERLASADLSARGIMRQMKVVAACTTDDPTDSLEHHKAIAADEGFAVQVRPTWRPDKGMAIEDPERFNGWVDQLAEAADVEIRNFASYMDALHKRHAYFHAAGCRLSDHGLETFCAEDHTPSEINAIFAAARAGSAVGPGEVGKFKSAMLYEFGLMDHAADWTQQYHFGCLRNNNPRLFEALGPDIGCDSMGDFEIARPLSKLLGRLDRTDQLTRTILYNLNPRDNMLIATMIGNFQDGRTPGKMQLGSGWWFLDQIDGMERQIEAVSQAGLLSRFVGMLTDSRSFLSYPRHEYFRRILCNVCGSDMTRGRLPNDFDLLGAMIRDISYNNAADYFGFDLPKLQG